MLYKTISLLITHYNRSQSLEKLLLSLEKQQIYFNEIVVSDDGSKQEHLDKLKLMKDRFNFKLICTDKNKGLANNINKGQRAISSPYTIYIQEDFIPTDKFKNCLTDGLSLMENDPKLDMVRFYTYRMYPYLKPVKNGFYEMIFNFWYPSYWEFQYYSDHPHLRRSNFLEKFGEFKEGIHSDKAEFKMSISFLQKKGKAVIHKDYKEIFIQENSTEEPSQVSRKKIREYIRLTNSFPVKIVRSIYRFIKFRLQYLFT